MSQSNSKSFNSGGTSTTPNRQSNITRNNDDTEYSYSAEMLISRTVRVPLGQPLSKVQETLLSDLPRGTSPRDTSSGIYDTGNEDPARSPTRTDHGHNDLQEHLLTDQDPTADEENNDDDDAQGENHDQEDGSARQQQRWTALATEVHPCMILDPILEICMEELGNTEIRRRVDQDPTRSWPPRQ